MSAPHIVFNTLPQDAARIAGLDDPVLKRLSRRVSGGWSAGMIFRTVRPPEGCGPGAQHLEMVADPGAPFLEGNHVFMSIGAEQEGVSNPALRRATLSTHISVDRIRGDQDGGRAYVQQIQDRMRRTVAELAPEWCGVVREFTGSARTFKRWTGRSDGLVGGIPRRAGWVSTRASSASASRRGSTWWGTASSRGRARSPWQPGGAEWPWRSFVDWAPATGN